MESSASNTALAIFALQAAEHTSATSSAESTKPEADLRSYFWRRDHRTRSRVEVVVPTLREIRSIKRELGPGDHELTRSQDAKRENVKNASKSKAEPISDAELRARFGEQYKEVIKLDVLNETSAAGQREAAARIDASITLPALGDSGHSKPAAGENVQDQIVDLVHADNDPNTTGAAEPSPALIVKAEPVDDILLVQDTDVAEPTDEQIQDALAHMKNPDAKIKKNLTFSDRILYRRIQKIGPELYPVEDSVNKFFLFSRYYFSNRYGGSFVATFPTMSEAKVKEHGIDDWAFPSLEYNPHAPQVPGAPGLFYTPNGHARRTFEHRVFVRLDSGKWLYVGVYRFAPSDSLTTDEYKSQPDKIKKTWAREIRHHTSWGTDVIARVYFRRENDGREPTEPELERVMVDKIALQSVSEDEIIEAYALGQEVFGVWSMKCINYNAQWISELVEDYPSWLTEREAQVKANKAKRKAKKAAKKIPKRKPKNKAAESRAGDSRIAKRAKITAKGEGETYRQSSDPDEGQDLTRTGEAVVSDAQETSEDEMQIVESTPRIRTSLVRRPSGSRIAMEIMDID